MDALTNNTLSSEEIIDYLETLDRDKFTDAVDEIRDSIDEYDEVIDCAKNHTGEGGPRSVGTQMLVDRLSELIIRRNTYKEVLKVLGF